MARLDAMGAMAGTRVMVPQGVMPEARATVVQLNALLTYTRESLKKVGAVLTEAPGIGSNVRVATDDLGRLRSAVETNLHKIEGMIDQLNRRWPFARVTEIKLP